MNSAMKIGQSILEPVFILLPGDTVHSGCGLPLEGEKAFPQQIDCQMVEQGGELHLLIFPCCFPHASQPLGHALPALRRVRVRLTSVLLDQRPSLPTLRRQFPVFVRMVHRYYSPVCPLSEEPAALVARPFARRPATWLSRRCLRGLPVLVHEVSRRVWGLRLRRTEQELALSRRFMLPSAHFKGVGVWIASFRS